jgi:oligopeptide transport system ATP-binding protein
MEMSERKELFENPQHPYTKALLSAVPVPNPRTELTRERVVLQGNIPSPINAPSGCVFNTRCPIATDECKVEIPVLKEYAPGHWAACIKL